MQVEEEVADKERCDPLRRGQQGVRVGRRLVTYGVMKRFT